MSMPAGISLAALLLLTACGTETVDRAGTGAVIGAAGGALAGAAVGMPLTGAVLGASVGATAGALTTPAQVDLGKPIWR